jgi:hypothetical protein
LVEFAKGWFVVRQSSEPGFGRLTALEKREWQKWVDSVEKVGFLRVSRKGVLIDCRGFAEAGR